jgi:hypothetical protein
MPVFFIRQRTAVTYQGPGDIVSGATAWYGLRAYNAAYATGSNNAINVRRASDNSTSNIVILANGNLDIATANTFAGVDATATATVSASTTIALTGASSTPHVGSTITGTGIVQPCYIVSVGSFVAGAGNITVNAAQTLAAVSISMQYGLYVTEAYDQTGSGRHLTQSTAAKQPQLLPAIGNGLPSLSGTNASGTGLTFAPQTAPTIAQPLTISVVAQYITQADTRIFSLRAGSTAPFLSINATANTGYLYAGTPSNFTLSINVNHAIQGLFNGASSIAYVDGSSTSVNPGTSSTQTVIGWLQEDNGGQTQNLTGYSSEAGYWPIGFTPTQAGNMRTNQKNYWGTP